jgi:hypothetical protein
MKERKKKSRRILDVTAKICGTQWEERKKDLINSSYWRGTHRTEYGNLRLASENEKL